MNILLLTIGLLSVYFGYRLFCSLSRRALHTVTGALLAMSGIAVLVGQGRGLARQKSQTAPIVHEAPAWRNGSAPSIHVRQHRNSIA